MQTGVTRMVFCFVNVQMVCLMVGQMERSTGQTDTKTNLLLDIQNLVERKQSDPEQVLFLSVILQALLDASKKENDRESVEAKIERDKARAWFSASVGVTAEDFNTVCDIAGVNPAYVRSFAFKILESKEIEFVRKRINAVLSFDQGVMLIDNENKFLVRFNQVKQ